MINRNTIDDSSGSTRWLIAGVWLLVVITQAIITWTWPAIACAVLAVIGAVAGVQYSMRPGMLERHPLSSAMLLGFTAYYFLLPALITSIEMKPLTNNLALPIAVHIHALLTLAGLIVAHSLYRYSGTLHALRHQMEWRVWRPLAYFQMPSHTHLYAIGAVGLTATAYQIFTTGAAQLNEAESSITTKIMQGLYPLAYVPYAIALRRLVDGASPRLTGSLAGLAVYTVLLVAIGMGRNSRSAVLLGLTSAAMAWGYLLMINSASRKSITLGRVSVAVLIAWMIGGPLSDLATSMVIARSQRASVSASELITETLTTYSQKELIEAYRKEQGAAQSHIWDEGYVDNLFAARLCNLKFSDAALSLANVLDPGDSEILRDLEWQRAISVFPRPLLEFFAPETDKDFVKSGSGGDLLLFVATNRPEVVGGFRTGSLFGSGYAMFGWWYIPLIMALALPTFALADSNSTRIRLSGGSYQWVPVFSPFILVSAFSWFYYFTSAATGVESMSGLSQFLMRGWLQGPLLYIAVYWLTLWPATLLDQRLTTRFT